MQERVLDGDLIKVGRRSGWDLCLDGIGRMHAVLERTMSAGWSVVDLGTSVGTLLDGQHVSGTARMGDRGVLAFGDWRVEYEVVQVTARERIDALRDEMREEAVAEWGRGDSWGGEHHASLLRSLAAELVKTSPGAAATVEKIEARWSFLSMERKLGFLRFLVNAVRESRVDHDRHARLYATSILEIGPGAIERAFSLAPEEALDRAYETIVSMATAKHALALLREMGLEQKIGKVMEGEREKGNDDGVDKSRSVLAGHGALVQRLEKTLTGGTALLLVYIQRAGGASLSDAERQQMHEAFAAAHEAANATT